LVHNGGKIADLAETIGRKAYLWIGFLSSQLWAIFSFWTLLYRFKWANLVVLQAYPRGSKLFFSL
jgi:hypothetical protein